MGLGLGCLPQIVSKEAKLAKQEGDEVSDTHTHTYKSKKSLPNNGLEDPILVVNHCVGIMYTIVLYVYGVLILRSSQLS